MTPEGRVKEWVKRVLKKHGCYSHMPVMNGMGDPTLDFVCCHCGWFVAVETKAPGGKPTKRQQVTMDQMRAAGAEVFLVNDEASLHMLDATLYFLRSNPMRDQLAAHYVLHESH
jgi:hypothetical protein